VTAAPRTPRRTFGGTWWGRAWVEAMEQRARLDPNRLPRGRTYARNGRVGKLAVAPGEVSAAVWGSRATPYVVKVRVRVLRDEEWDRVLDAVAGRAAHTAALLDGELPPEVVADAAAAGVELLPGPGEVVPRCSCPDWAEPCKHAAAVVYLVADELDADPFALLWLRGRSRQDVLAELRRRRAGVTQAAGVVGGRPVDHGVVAGDAFATRAEALPAVPLAPRQPGQPVPLAVDPPHGSGLRATDLVELASDAARRAWEMCSGEGDGDLGLDPFLDLVRRAAAWSGSPGRSRLADTARRAGMGRQDLDRRAMAWRRGRADAVAVLDETWAAGRDAMEEGAAAGGRVRDNRITLTGGAVQLRLGRGGQWYRFEQFGRRWEMVAGPAADPAALLNKPAAST
jgi:uncharacterized Zn finger protein